jgi:hypothetical protein
MHPKYVHGVYNQSREGGTIKKYLFEIEIDPNSAKGRQISGKHLPRGRNDSKYSFFLHEDMDTDRVDNNKLMYKGE